MTQPQTSVMQLWLASVHLAAAGLALAFATTHLVATLYHLERSRQPSVVELAEQHLKEIQR